MSTVGFVYWQDGKYFIGHLDEFPDYMTQGETLDELKENLADIYREINSGEIPHLRRHAELEVV